MAKTQGCFTIVFNKEEKLLLVKRKDYPIWDLPGGWLEEDELLENCAVRETEEETGYIPILNQKVGEYFQPQYDDLQHLFVGEVKSGSPIKNGIETDKVQWFYPDRLPYLMVPNRKKQIKNYLKDRNKLIKSSIFVSPIRIFFLKGFLTLLKKIQCGIGERK
ncbi:NUDIX hydrolase [Bacillus salitolerans]|uniref:NUDIX hydrolase n=1 Tax=Bacillus salitolerans TaxID=1437434 RepID=A0ABW4LQH5_9BACI